MSVRSGLENFSSSSGSKLFDTVIAFLKEFFEKVNFKKKSAYDKFSSMQRFGKIKKNMCVSGYMKS